MTGPQPGPVAREPGEPGDAGAPGANSESQRLYVTVVLAVFIVLVLLAVGLVLGHYGERADLARIFGGHVSENASLAGLLAVPLLGALLVLVSRRGGQLLGVVGATFKEVRRGGALWLALFAALAVACGAPFLQAAGGAPGRVKMILTVAVGTASVVGTLLAVALPALTFSREMETRSIYVAATKPAPRWVIYTGKLGGIALALAVAVAALGLGALAAVHFSLWGGARRARAEGRDPEHVWLTAYYSRRDTRPPAAPGPGGRRRRPATFYWGKPRRFTVRVPASERGRKWLVLRIHAGPANPNIQTSPAEVRCGGRVYRVNVDRSIPVDLVVPGSAAKDGSLAVALGPVEDAEGINRGLHLPARGPVAVAAAGDGMTVTLAKSLGLIWLQLLVVAAVTLTAASALSFPVAAVTGVAAAITGHLSGLAVGILRYALRTGKDVAAGGHVHGPGCGCGHGDGPAGEVSALGQLVRQEVAGLLAVLPDFEAAGTSEYLASGDYVPWRFMAAAVLGLLVLRTLPAALLGCLVFSRREVGA